MPHIDALIVEGEDPYFAYSAKGAGEVSNTPTPAAIRNAIHDAVGIWFNDLPITPNRIITAINEKKKVSEKIAIRTA
jgi:CO/xanthine dehydrogenase Mo-binding subunit